MRREFEWIVPATVLVAAQQILCVILQMKFGLAGSPPYINYGLVAFGAVCLVFALLLLHSLMLGVGRPSQLRQAKEYFLRRRRIVGVFLIGFVLGWLQLVFLTWTKSLIPVFEPMWADPLLARLDHGLFGVDPWRLVDPFMRPFGRQIDDFYGLWVFVLQFVLIAVLFARPSQRKSRVLLTFFLAMAIVGVLGQFLLPSGGPIFWHRLGLGHRFDGLRSEPHTVGAAQWLWTKYVGDTVDFATGISAFPSMHIAMTSWMVIAVHALYPRVRAAFWAYFLIIFMGSVFLGWHYIVDGLGGALGTILCWYASAALVAAPSGADNSRPNSHQLTEPGNVGPDKTENVPRVSADC